MITGKPTENLNGILLEGEYSDFHDLVDSIYRITGLEEDYNDPYWSVKNRLLGLCYDIRHAYQGDRTVKLADNGTFEELKEWHSMDMPSQNVHYAVEVLFPEAVFVALSVPEIYFYSVRYYGKSARDVNERRSGPEITPNKYADYIRDQALLDTLRSVILAALAEVIGDEELENLIHLKELRQTYEGLFANYAAQYVDKCNLEYLKTPRDKKSAKLRNITRRLINKPSGYNSMLVELLYSAELYGCSFHELHDPKHTYPEQIDW